MVSFQHKNRIQEITALSSAPDDPKMFDEWLSGREQVSFLLSDLSTDEIVLYAGSNHLYVESAVIPLASLGEHTAEHFLEWSGAVWSSCASFTTGGGRTDTYISRGESLRGNVELQSARPLVYGRQFEGLVGPGSTYFEVAQEYAHIAGIHWRPEQSAYCRFDENGDFDPIVSTTVRGGSKDDVSLVSFCRDTLDEYMGADRSVLIRLFDFTLYRTNEFDRWSDGNPEIISESPNLAFRRKVDSRCSYLRGAQIVRPALTPDDVTKRIFSFSGPDDKQYVSFTAQDWRNEIITEISTAPDATTNYFECEGNDLPFELSPAFFRSDVLSKHRNDKDKYSVGDRDITCRGAWYLKGYDVNDAGQIHVYICDLRTLPYSEQLYWKSFNEEPKSSISKRALTTDFKGEWSTDPKPLQETLRILDSWERKRPLWWRLTDDNLLRKIAVPLTGSRDEWADAFMDLDQLVIEGFRVKPLRQWLSDHGVTYETSDQSIALLERVLKFYTQNETLRLDALRLVRKIRSKVKGHSGSSEANQISSDAIEEHGSYARHFQSLCSDVNAELENIYSALR